MILLFWLGCRPEVCTTDPGTLPVFGDEGDEASVLDDVWQGFAEAVAPAELCVTAAEVWSVRDWRVEGRYRSVRRNIWVGRDEPEAMQTALRHELCHAFDQQVLTGPLPDEFTVETRLTGMHPGKLPGREAFAWTCSLEPPMIAAFSAASCGEEPGTSSFAFVADEVYVSAPAVPEYGVHRRDIPLDASIRPDSITSVEAFVTVPGAIGALLGYDDGSTELAWVELDAGRVSREAPEGAIGVVAPVPSADPPVTSSLSLTFLTVTSDRTQVAWIETALLSGYPRRQLVSRDGERWGVAPEACGIPLDDRTSFFLGGPGKALTSVSALDDGSLAVIDWEGPPGD